MRYTDDVSLPVNRYWPTKTSSPGCTNLVMAGSFTARKSLDAFTRVSVVSVTRRPCTSSNTSLGAAR